MENFLYTLAVPVLSFFPWLAYKHPKGYHRIFPWLMSIVGFSFCFLVLYNIAYTQGAMDAHEFYKVKDSFNWQKFDNAFDITLTKSYITFLVLIIYFLLLNFTHQILGIESDKTEDTKQD